MNLHISRYNWLFTYKLYHLPFWFIYHYLWWAINIGNPWQAASNIFFSPYSIKFSFYVIFQAIGVYFNLYYLIPKFLEKGRYTQYLSLLLLTIIICAAFIVTGYYVSAFFSVKTFKELYGIVPENGLHFFQVNSLPSTAASMTLGMSVKLAKNWIEANRRQQMLEKEKLETELKFLKSQFNPHFLFNTINSIFVLIHKNPGLASESLAKFSDLLRYQLYDCNEQQIPVDQELSYLENFIELEKLRQDHHIILTLQIEQAHPCNLTIAPFILMPFIENAFKHVSKGKGEYNWIKMNLRFEGRQLHFDIANSTSTIASASGEISKHCGIGLKNVQRRLDLLYPEQHSLAIHRDPDQFRVSLLLHLQEGRFAERAGALQTTAMN